MIQTIGVPLSAKTFPEDFSNDVFGRDLQKALTRLIPGAAKFFGSAIVSPGDANDIDVAVASDDSPTLAYLLNISKAYGLHPVSMPRWMFDDLHNLLSWKNMCVTADAATGDVLFGTHYTAGTELQFNPASRRAFPDFMSARRAAAKLEKRGYRVPDSEKARAELHLLGNTAALIKIAREALGDRLVSELAEYDAVIAGGFFRDEVDGRYPKDLDIFVSENRNWEGLCRYLASWMEEVEVDMPAGKGRVNLRKFRAKSRCPGHEMLVLDVIDYGFAHKPEHVVETFDFSCNTLWWTPRDPYMHGGFGLTPEQVIEHIRTRKLVVGDNMWYRAGLYRALKRWQRFKADGYVADVANTEKYSEYVKFFSGK